MTYEQLRAIIIAKMMTFDGIEQERIDYLNPVVRFTPPQGGVWCRLYIEPARPTVQGLCEPRARIPGTIVVQCFERTLHQSVGLIELVDKLVGHFQFWSAPGLLCREAQLIDMGAHDGVYQLNVQIYFVAG